MKKYLTVTVLITALLMLLSGSVFQVNSQVLSDFENGTLEGWRAVGDGSFNLEAGTGNPGYCMRVDDDATGSLLFAIAPLKFLGDWSMATVLDSIKADLFVHLISGSLIAPTRVFTISGPGGRAFALAGSAYIPANEVWTRYAVSLDSGNWTISQGNWNAILQQVTLLEIQVEYVNGDEYVRLDNASLSFSPLIQTVVPPVYSEFNQGSFEGWTFVNTAGASVQNSGGNPGGYIRILDQAGVVSQAVASPVFYGNWQQLNQAAALQLDLKLENTSGTFSPTLDLIRLSGPGGVATVPMDSALWEARNQWRTFSFLLQESRWNMVSGTWNGLLAQVDEILLNLEFFDGSEVVCFDNFRLTDSPPQANFEAGRRYLFLGDTARFVDRSLFAPHSWLWSFGDGQQSGERDPLHYYSDAGDYSVTLRVTNYFGTDSLTRSNYIHIHGITDSVLFSDNFNDGVIHPAWQLINGTWVENDGMLSQTSNYYGIGFINGAFALSGSRLWSDYTVTCDLMSLDDDLIGMAFRYQDARNFYLFTMQSEGTARFLKKFVDGQEVTLASDPVGYQIGGTYRLRIVADGQLIRCYVNNVLVFDVVDSTFATGKVALYCWGNQGSYWDNFAVINNQYVSISGGDSRDPAPDRFQLYQNYPNPFNPSTKIQFLIPKKEFVTLKIFNLLGEEVCTLLSGQLPSGLHQVEWEAADLPSGVYLYRLQAGDYRETRKMVVLK